MSPTLKARHLGRYRDIGTLLIKHGRHAWTDPSHADAMEEDARQLVEDLEAMGPTYVKLGQLLSTRADLLPPM